ncbi:MAG: carotenoid oxygenase family protein [Deltaproteobacteria bacterium]|nr:carotenoid oxygenase family protein [Deltaproteobacteria bacterium]
MVARAATLPVIAAHADRTGGALAASLWTTDLSREHGFEPLEVEGTLPAELRGTLFRNGPGKFGQFGRRYSHPFEADGAVTAVRFGDGQALGASRVTASAGLRDERAAGKQLYGMSVPWLRRIGNSLGNRQKNTANTSVVMWQGRLFALMEAARPTELDPRDLSTIGETNLDGVVVSTFSAHPHRVAARRATYNFGLEYGRQTRLHTYELPDVGPARHLGAIDLPGAPMLHDFIATDTHLVVFLSPVRIDVPRMLLGLGSFRDLFKWRPELGTEIICIPIDRPTEPVRFTVEAFYQWHFANAFIASGTRDRELVIDYVRQANFDSFYELGELAHGGPTGALAAGRMHRATIDLEARTFRSEPLFDRACEFPTVAPAMAGRTHAHTYVVLDDLAAVGKLDARSNTLAAHELPASQRATEALFIPRPDASTDDDGHVLALCHDGPSDRAFVAVYDARRLPDGPLARAWFDHQVPITFHGTWSPMV